MERRKSPEITVIVLFVVIACAVFALYPLQTKWAGFPPIAWGFVILIFAPTYLGLLYNYLLEQADSDLARDESGAANNSSVKG